MLRFLNELNRFRNSYDKRMPSTKNKRSKSKQPNSERRRKNTSRKNSNNFQEWSKDYENILDSFRIGDSMLMRGNQRKRRRRGSRAGRDAGSKIHQSEIQQQPIKIEDQHKLQTNMQLLTKSLLVRNDVKTRMNSSNHKSNDYNQKLYLKQKFLKAMHHVYNCIRMLPVINQQCVIGTIGEKMYYFLGKVMYKVIAGRTLQMGLKQFIQQCENLFQHATAKDIEILLSTPAPPSPALPPSYKQNCQNNFDSENYLIREASSVQSSARKTNASTIKQSVVRESLQIRDYRQWRAPTQSLIHSREKKMSKKNSYRFDKDRVLQQQNALQQLNARLGQYLDRTKQHRPFKLDE